MITIEKIIELLENIFYYFEDAPMIFTRFYFWGFFVVAMLLYSIFYKRKSTRNIYLFLISIFFYYKTSGLFFLLLIFSTLTDYSIGLGIFHAKKQQAKKILLILSVVINLTVLCYFKYAYFFVDSYNQLFLSSNEVFNYLAYWANAFTPDYFDVDRIILPVGISFFTFQTISYTVDVYRGKCMAVRNVFDFGFYVSYFPQLVAGPIVRASEFIPQLYQPYNVTKQEFGWALYLILVGLVKKMVIGDYIAVNFIDRVFANPWMFDGFSNLVALFGYSLQVYLDFSGYTDIAIGVALLMGFRLPKNFNSPYKALNVGEFWKRWHMSLSSWLKDYLYIPLGGNRSLSVVSFVIIVIIVSGIVLLPEWNLINIIFLIAALLFVILSMVYKKWILILLGMLTILGQIFYIGASDWFSTVTLSFTLLMWLLVVLFPKIKKNVITDTNLMITMLLGGLWHGASAKFIIWGGLNGLGLIVYKLWRNISPYENSNTHLTRFWKILLTFNFITFTRIFFRAENMDKAKGLMNQIVTDLDFTVAPSIMVTYWQVFLLMIIGYVAHWLPSSFKEESRGLFIRTPMVGKAIITLIIIFIIIQMQAAGLQPFIYFQF